MKKILYILIILVLIFNLVGCTKNEKADNQIPTGYEKYIDSNGWSILYPETFDKIEDTFIQETSSGQTIQFSSEIISKEDLLSWINSEIERKLSADEANNSLFEELTVKEKSGLELYEYTIQSDMDGATYFLKTSIYFDGNMKYVFMGSLPTIDGEVYEAIVNSFNIEK